PKTKAIIPVHLYGHPVNIDPIKEIAQKHNLFIIEDTAQAIGAEYKGKKVATFGDIGCISFFPSKNLGAYGDAGMLTTNNDELAEKIRMIIVHGSKIRYYHEILGVNSRLDSIQAAILNVKLKYLDEWNKFRQNAANTYNQLLNPKFIKTPVIKPYAKHIFHQYTIRVQHRDKLSEYLKSENIPHAIYYP
ncbi:MAG: DegT/DnrJ/EryC1/StrS family aminotransferase, partial [Bacteroidetes bacterium]|nr:DegT/DnrJ/EryC1/StrS family aminotransferase [Bacteroidota bacterium]